MILSACGGPGDDAQAPLPEEPTFSSHVAEILYRECTPCHRAGDAAPLPLESYEDARGQADLIAQVVSDGRMPPWLPEPGDYPFAGERRLSDREIEILRRWAEQSAPEGDPDEVPSPPPTAGGWSLGEPDLVLEMPEPYLVPPRRDVAPGPGSRHHDVFRNFVLRVPVEEARYVRAVEFLPGDARVVHHAILSVDPTPSSRRAAARDPEPGFDGMFTRTAARPPGGFFIGWTPGRVPRPNPGGLAWPLEPGTDFVVQAHFRPRADPVPVRFKVGFHFGDEAPERTPVLLHLTDRTIRIPPGEETYAVEDRFRIPVDAELLGVYPHAHYLARTMRAWAVLPDGDERTLLHIDQWDFDWQDAYTFEAPVALPQGTELRMRYVYDNSVENPRNPYDPPQPVSYGPNSTDEMAELWIQALTSDPGDLSELREAVNAKAREDYVAGWRHLIELNPDDAWAHANLASVYEAQGRVDESIEHYRRAIDLDPDLELAHFGLAGLLAGQGELAEARRHHREALRAAPDFAPAHTALGTLLSHEGRTDEAEEHYRLAIEVDPQHVEAHLHLGELLRDEGRIEEALNHYQRAVELGPHMAEARFTLALNLILVGQPDRALEHGEIAARLAPREVQSRLAVAWMLATHPEPSVRRPDAAVRLVEDLLEEFEGEPPLVLDVLAAGHAAAGRFREATRIAERAHRLAIERGEEELAGEIRLRLELYREERPFAVPAY